MKMNQDRTVTLRWGRLFRKSSAALQDFQVGQDAVFEDAAWSNDL
jgi:hypothetical protein